MATSSLRDLKVWQESVALAGDIVRAVRQSARKETMPLTDSIIECAVDVAVLIAKAHSAHGHSDARDLYGFAKQDLLKLETLMGIARHADVLPASTQTVVLDHCQLLHRLLAGYLVYLDRQLAEKEETT